jgi:hypothetical protein
VGRLQPWLGRVLRWRVSPWFYVFAFGFPAVLYGLPNVILASFGAQPDLSLLAERLPAYAATWVAALFMGGLEEPGWRGFALPRLQQRYTPVRGDLLLGAVWGLWHLPVEPLAILVTVPLAFFYTWLFDRTGSALLCMLLHASITPAQEHNEPGAGQPDGGSDDRRDWCRWLRWPVVDRQLHARLAERCRGRAGGGRHQTPRGPMHRARLDEYEAGCRRSDEFAGAHRSTFRPGQPTHRE